MNTTTLANKLMVSPKTIRRWIQTFQLQFEKNEHGHYQFTEEDYILFQSIKSNLSTGKSFKEIQRIITTDKTDKPSNINKQNLSDYEHLFNKLFETLKIHEKRISEKADEVVSYQILQHRREMEELQTKISSLENKICELEKQQMITESTDTPIIEERRKRKGLFRAVLG